MGEQQGRIYDPILKRGVTIEEAQRLIAQRATAQPGATPAGVAPPVMSVSNPMASGQSVGINLPPMDEQSVMDIAKTLPQLAGLVAQFTPVGRTGYTGAMAVPAGIELIRQLASGEEPDATKAATQGAMGAVAKFGGNTIRRIGQSGMDIVRRSLNLGSGPFAYNEVAEQMLPKLAVQEGASMTKAGVETARKRAADTGLGGLQDLADTLEKGRYDAANSPTLSGGGLMSILTHFLDNPKQLKIGQQMTEPLGLASTENTIAPSVEATIRSLMALLSSRQGTPETRRREP